MFFYFKIIFLTAFLKIITTMDKTPQKISLFYCSNCINVNELLTSKDLNKEFEIKNIGLSCSGRVNIQYLLKAIETGSDGAVLLTCPQGACTFVEGNRRAKKRVIAVNTLLKESGFENDRIKLVLADSDDAPNQIIEKVINACKTIINVPKEGHITV